MGRQLSELSIEQLVASLISTEKSAGATSDGATALRREVERRQAAEPSIAELLTRARRFAVLIDQGETMAFFHQATFTRADRSLARALGAVRTWPRLPVAEAAADAGKGLASRIRMTRGAKVFDRSKGMSS